MSATTTKNGLSVQPSSSMPPRLLENTDDAAIFVFDTVDASTARMLTNSPSAVAVLTPQRHIPPSTTFSSIPPVPDFAEYDEDYLGASPSAYLAAPTRAGSEGRKHASFLRYTSSSSPQHRSRRSHPCPAHPIANGPIREGEEGDGVERSPSWKGGTTLRLAGALVSGDGPHSIGRCRSAPRRGLGPGLLVDITRYRGSRSPENLCLSSSVPCTGGVQETPDVETSAAIPQDAADSSDVMEGDRPSPQQDSEREEKGGKRAVEVPPAPEDPIRRMVVRRVPASSSNPRWKTPTCKQRMSPSVSLMPHHTHPTPMTVTRGHWRSHTTTNHLSPSAHTPPPPTTTAVSKPPQWHGETVVHPAASSTSGPGVFLLRASPSPRRPHLEVRDGLRGEEEEDYEEDEEEEENVLYLSMDAFEKLRKERNRFEKMYEHQKALYMETRERCQEVYTTSQQHLHEKIALSSRLEECKKALRQQRSNLRASYSDIMARENTAIVDLKARNELMREVAEYREKYERLAEDYASKLAAFESLYRDLYGIRMEGADCPMDLEDPPSFPAPSPSHHAPPLPSLAQDSDPIPVLPTPVHPHRTDEDKRRALRTPTHGFSDGDLLRSGNGGHDGWCGGCSWKRSHISQLDTLLKASYAKTTVLVRDLLHQRRANEALFDERIQLKQQWRVKEKTHDEKEARLAFALRQREREGERLLMENEELKQAIVYMRQLLIRTMDPYSRSSSRPSSEECSGSVGQEEEDGFYVRGDSVGGGGEEQKERRSRNRTDDARQGLHGSTQEDETAEEGVGRRVKPHKRMSASPTQEVEGPHEEEEEEEEDPQGRKRVFSSSSPTTEASEEGGPLSLFSPHPRRIEQGATPTDNGHPFLPLETRTPLGSTDLSLVSPIPLPCRSPPISVGDGSRVEEETGRRSPPVHIAGVLHWCYPTQEEREEEEGKGEGVGSSRVAHRPSPPRMAPPLTMTAPTRLSKGPPLATEDGLVPRRQAEGRVVAWTPHGGEDECHGMPTGGGRPRRQDHSSVVFHIDPEDGTVSVLDGTEASPPLSAVVAEADDVCAAPSKVLSAARLPFPIPPEAAASPPLDAKTDGEARGSAPPRRGRREDDHGGEGPSLDIPNDPLSDTASPAWEEAEEAACLGPSTASRRHSRGVTQPPVGHLPTAPIDPDTPKDPHGAYHPPSPRGRSGTPESGTRRSGTTIPTAAMRRTSGRDRRRADRPPSPSCGEDTTPPVEERPLSRTLGRRPSGGAELDVHPHHIKAEKKQPPIHGDVRPASSAMLRETNTNKHLPKERRREEAEKMGPLASTLETRSLVPPVTPRQGLPCARADPSLSLPVPLTGGTPPPPPTAVVRTTWGASGTMPRMAGTTEESLLPGSCGGGDGRGPSGMSGESPTASPSTRGSGMSGIPGAVADLFREPALATSSMRPVEGTASLSFLTPTPKNLSLWRRKKRI